MMREIPAGRSGTAADTFWVYQMFDYSGTDDEPSPALMSQLIRQVQQLR